jgi:hypothetical protein
LYYAGVAPKKNIDVMREAIKVAGKGEKKKKKDKEKKKSKKDDSEEEEEEEEKPKVRTILYACSMSSLRPHTLAA